MVSRFVPFRPQNLNTVPGIERSEAVFKATGANGVAEPAALLASGGGKLIVPKQKKGNVTVAIALKTVPECGIGARNGE